MDSAYDNALKRKQELLSELAEIEVFLRLHERFAARTKGGRQSTEVVTVIPSQSGHSLIKQGGQDTGAPLQISPHKIYRVRRRSSNPDTYASLAEAAIRVAGRPMSRAEIVTAIEHEGYSIPSEDKERYVGTIMWRRKDKFFHIGKEGYYLIELMTKDEIRRHLQEQEKMEKSRHDPLDGN